MSRVSRDGLRQRLKLEVRRQAKLHLVGSSGKRRRGPQPRHRSAFGPGRAGVLGVPQGIKRTQPGIE